MAYEKSENGAERGSYGIYILFYGCILGNDLSSFAGLCEDDYGGKYRHARPCTWNNRRDSRINRQPA